MKEAAFLKLVADVESGDIALQEAAANKICAIKDKGLLPVIQRTLSESENPLVQRVMLWALRNYLRHISFAEYLVWLCADDFGVREAALVLFMEGGRAAVDVLVSAVKCGSERERFAAVAALGQFRDAAAIEPLLFASGLPDAEVREVAVLSLGVYDADVVTRRLLDSLGDVPEVRLAALSGLKGRCLGVDDAAAVGCCLDDADEEVRAACVYVLDVHVPDEAADDVSPVVRRACASVTVNAAVLAKLCGDADFSVRSAAAESIGRLKLNLASVLIPLLKDEVPGVRRAAAAALGCCDEPGVVSALIGALHDSKPGVCAAAAASLGNIGGEEVICALEQFPAVKNPVLSGIVKNALENAKKRG